MGSYVLGFQEIDQTQVAIVGGKGAHLGELSRIEGIRVPAGFCVTTDAFRRIIAEAPSIRERLEQLSCLNPDDGEVIRTLSAEPGRRREMGRRGRRYVAEHFDRRRLAGHYRSLLTTVADRRRR